MFNELTEMIDALKSIAQSLHQIATQGIPGYTGAAAGPAPVNTAAAQPTMTDYAAMAKQDGGRGILLGLCKNREIPVPNGTKTTTLIKKLTTWDAVNSQPAPAAPQPAPAAAAQPAPAAAAQPDPLGAAAPLDPFAAAAPAEPVLTRDVVLEKCKEYMAKHGTAPMSTLFQEIAGTMVFPEIDPKHYPALYAKVCA